MALQAGNATCTAGLSKRIYDYWTGDATNGFSSPLSTGQANAVKSMCYAIARAVVDEIVANGQVNVTISTSDSGLQRDNTGGNPATLAPLANKTITGVVV